jgi:hypothetical protein
MEPDLAAGTLRELGLQGQSLIICGFGGTANPCLPRKNLRRFRT